MSAHPQSIGEPPPAGGLLLPMGGGYGELMPGLAAALFAHCRTQQITLVVLPPSFSSNPLQIPAAERSHNLATAECRRLALETALQAAAPAGVGCSVVLAPICTRADAEDPHHLEYFGAELNAAFLLGGDQAIAMQVLAGTPVEAALCDLHRRGGVIAGTSAGAGVQARTMLAGYADGVDAPHPLEQGIVSLWDRERERGLACGQAGVIIDQHFFQRGRLPRLLEAIMRPGAPHIGVGIDACTGLRMRSERPDGPHAGNGIDGAFGLYAAAVLDADSLGAAAGVRYCGPQRTLSVRDVLLHVLAPGPFAYDLDACRHSLAPLPLPRQRRRLTAPTGAGLLLLSGGVGEAAAGGALQLRFLASAGARGPLLVAALNGAAQPAARQCAQLLASSRPQLAAPAGLQTGLGPAPLPSAVDLVYGCTALAERLCAPQRYAGIAVLGGWEDDALPPQLVELAAAWRAGAALWLAGEVANAAGCWRGGRLPAVDENDAPQTAQRRAPLQGITTVQPGLGLLPITLEPRVLEDSRWGRLLALAWEQAGQTALGLGAGATLVVDSCGAEMVGTGSIFALDLCSAERRLGENGAYVFANGLLDAYAPGEEIMLFDSRSSG